MPVTAETNFNPSIDVPRGGSTLRLITRAARGAVGQTAALGKLQKAVSAAATTQARTKVIEDIAVGDSVWAWDENSRELVRRPVKRLFRHQSKPILAVTITNDDGLIQVIEATTEHPFWVEGRGWIAANELRVGDILKRIDTGSTMQVASVNRTGRKADVFNFEVDAQHNYFIGRCGILVHNSSERDSFVLGASGGLQEQAARALAQQIADGHAWSKHRDEFEALGVTKKGQFVERVKQTIVKPSLSGKRNDGDFFYDRESNILVIVDPKGKYRDGGTAYRPEPDVVRRLPGYAELHRSLAEARSADVTPESGPIAYAWNGDGPNPAKQAGQLRLLRDWQAKRSDAGTSDGSVSAVPQEALAAIQVPIVAPGQSTSMPFAPDLGGVLVRNTSSRSRSMYWGSSDRGFVGAGTPIQARIRDYVAARDAAPPTAKAPSPATAAPLAPIVGLGAKNVFKVITGGIVGLAVSAGMVGGVVSHPMAIQLAFGTLSKLRSLAHNGFARFVHDGVKSKAVQLVKKSITEAGDGTPGFQHVEKMFGGGWRAKWVMSLSPNGKADIDLNLSHLKKIAEALKAGDAETAEKLEKAYDKTSKIANFWAPTSSTGLLGRNLALFSGVLASAAPVAKYIIQGWETTSVTQKVVAGLVGAAAANNAWSTAQYVASTLKTAINPAHHQATLKKEAANVWREYSKNYFTNFLTESTLAGLAFSVADNLQGGGRVAAALGSLGMFALVYPTKKQWVAGPRSDSNPDGYAPIATVQRPSKEKWPVVYKWGQAFTGSLGFLGSAAATASNVARIFFGGH